MRGRGKGEKGTLASKHCESQILRSPAKGEIKASDWFKIGQMIERNKPCYAKPNVAIFNIVIFIQFNPHSFNLISIFIQFNPYSFNLIPIVIQFNPYSFNSIFRSIQFNFYFGSI